MYYVKEHNLVKRYTTLIFQHEDLEEARDFARKYCHELNKQISCEIMVSIYEEDVEINDVDYDDILRRIAIENLKEEAEKLGIDITSCLPKNDMHTEVVD